MNLLGLPTYLLHLCHCPWGLSTYLHWVIVMMHVLPESLGSVNLPPLGHCNDVCSAESLESANLPPFFHNGRSSHSDWCFRQNAIHLTTMPPLGHH